MDPESFTASLYKWNSRAAATAAVAPPQGHRNMFEAIPSLLPPPLPPPPQPTFLSSYPTLRPTGGELEAFFQNYGIRYHTITKIEELSFTVSTLLNMTDEEVDEMIIRVSQIFHWDFLVGEKYGIKAAIRAERRRLLGHLDPLDALSQEGLSEEMVHKEAAGSGGGATWEMITNTQSNKMKSKKGKSKRKSVSTSGDDGGEDEVDGGGGRRGRGGLRTREHPFIVTVPGDVAREKKNGIDYLFHLYEQCREFLNQVQNIAKEKGEKCPNKVTNQVYRFATDAGATYINKPKMRHYVHCYALHCLDEKASNALRISFVERQEIGVGPWREACYEPLVKMASCHGWDIDGIFNAHPRLSIWYVPTKLRKLCHAQRSGNISSAENSA
ncbi:hypothetical protein ACHQM5_006480 [Ranunculus cassubicifolius]